jgi:YVTN family beta-propeller protein
MNRNIYLILFSFLLFINGCLFRGSIPAQTFTNEGDVIILLQPMSQDALGFRFTIKKISAIRDDGSEIILDLTFKNINCAELTKRQQRIASGSLPDGRYKGLSVLIDKAYIMTEDGETSLLPPEAPLTVQGPFNVIRKGRTSLFLNCSTSGAAVNAVRFEPFFSLALPERGPMRARGYVSCTPSNSILVFNKITMQVTGMISTGTGPKGMVLDERRARIYVAVSGEDKIEVIDLLKEEIIGRINLNFQDQPAELALTADGKTLLSVNQGSGTISIIDAISFYETTRIKVGEKPAWVSISPSGLKAYVMNSSENSISIIDLTQRMLTSSLSVENAPIRSAFNREGSELYIILKDSPNMTVVNPVESKIVGRIFMGSGALSIKSDTQTGLVMVGRKYGGEISVIDPFSSLAIDTIAVHGNVTHMIIDDDEGTLYAVQPERKIVQKINLNSKQTIGEMETGDGPYSVVVLSER